MKDEIQMLWTGVKIRIKDTFSSTFMIAWLIWNWRAILYVIYPMSWDLDQRLNFIDGNIYDGELKTWLLLFFGPLVSALLFLLALPLATNRIDRTYQKYLIERRRSQVDAQSTLIYTAEEVAQVTEENRKLQQQLDQANEKIRNLGGEIFGLREMLNRAEGTAKGLLQHMSPADLDKARMSGLKV